MAYITLNKKHFFHNLDIIKTYTKTKDKIALVLKDNAYGHGLLEISSMAQEYGISKAVVQSYDEAIKIDSFFDYILVLADFPKKQNHKIRYVINDLSSIKKYPKQTRVELKVDTGMHRNGIPMDKIKDAFRDIKEHGLVLEGILTHHRSADELSSEWFWQKENFEKIKAEANYLDSEFGFKPLRFHSSNSASLFRYTNFDEDMARVGIAAYGCMELPPSFNQTELKPVLSVYAKRNSSRELKSGQRIGYGATYSVDEYCIVSNYNFGYGDGFLRICSNNYTTPDGKKLLGRISMDNSSFLADEEELLIFDDASKIAKSAKTISYEVLTSLKSDLKREIV